MDAYVGKPEPVDHGFQERGARSTPLGQDETEIAPSYRQGDPRQTGSRPHIEDDRGCPRKARRSPDRIHDVPLPESIGIVTGDQPPLERLGREE
jgi:hypothetical protein